MRHVIGNGEDRANWKREARQTRRQKKVTAIELYAIARDGITSLIGIRSEALCAGKHFDTPFALQMFPSEIAAEGNLWRLIIRHHLIVIL